MSENDSGNKESEEKINKNDNLCKKKAADDEKGGDDDNGDDLSAELVFLERYFTVDN